jgi:hypothetical protein
MYRRDPPARFPSVMDRRDPCPLFGSAEFQDRNPGEAWVTQHPATVFLSRDRREAAEKINSRRGVATHPMISAVALSGEDAEAGGRRRRAANPIQAIAIPAAIQPISP